ncbi:hypothetical protein LCGC14_0367000 [marine sediment metagenome]|uniref:Uncharacterized protein n=1 Tax=marine sediment metagenome TaxID=412755 RepID=A0A0F9TC44_9ZZZZ
MPSKTPKQAKFMRAVAHGWKPSRGEAPPVSVAKEFVSADKKAKGYQRGGTALRLLGEARDTRTSEERWREKYGTEPLTLRQASERVAGRKASRLPTAKRELERAGWTQSGEKWYPPEKTLAAPPTEGGLAAATEPVRTIDPVPGREFISSAAPPRRVGPPARTAADVAPGFRPGRVPPSLVAYLERARAAAGEEPVKMQFGGAMRGMMQRGRRGRRGMRGRGQPPGGGGLARAAVMPGSAPGPGGGGSPIQGFIDRGGIQGRQLRGPGAPGAGGGIGRPGVGQGQPRPQPPGAGVPLRGVGRPPGMGRPGAGGGAGDYQRMLQQRKQQATAPGAGGVRAAVMPGRGFMPGGGGAGMPGGANRIGMGDQQGAQARAMQVQTGRPPMSRRQPFPGRSRRSRGRFR